MTWTRIVELMRADLTDLPPDQAWRALLRLHASIDVLTNRLAPHLGLSTRELGALLALWNGGRCTMTELASRIAMSRAAITTMADRLERAGYATRLPDPTDRRRVLLIVTERFDTALSQAITPLAGRAELLAQHDDWTTFATIADGARAAASEATDDIELIVRGRADGLDADDDTLDPHW